MNQPRQGMSGLALTSLPGSAPKNLLRILGGLALRLRAGQLEEARVSLRDAAGFSVRYFAFVAAAAASDLKLEVPGLELLWRSTATVAECEVLLQRCLAALDRVDDKLARSLCEVFVTSFEGRAKLRNFTRTLGFGERRTGQRMSNLCAAGELSEEETTQALRLFVPALKEWMACAAHFFDECDHRYEAAHEFGKQELVVRFRQHILRTRLLLRLREARLAAAPSALGSVPLASPITVEEEEQHYGLSALVSHMLEASQGSSSPPPSPERPPEIGVSAEYRGYSKNGSARLGHAGLITLTNRGGGELRGSAISTNPLVEVTPSLFEGPSSALHYWIDPSAMPTPEGYLELRTPQELRRVPLTTLVPRSRLTGLARPALAGLLLAPGALGLAYTALVFRLTASSVVTILHREMGRDFTAWMQSRPTSFPADRLGALQLQVTPRIDAAQLMFLMFAILCPLLVAKIFRRYPRNARRELGFLFILGMLIPAVGFLALWNTNWLDPAGVGRPELAGLDFRTSFPWLLGLNLGISSYLFFSVIGKVDRWLRNPTVRLLVPPLLLLACGMLVFGVVYGSGWFS